MKYLLRAFSLATLLASPALAQVPAIPSSANQVQQGQASVVSWTVDQYHRYLGLPYRALLSNNQPGSAQGGPTALYHPAGVLDTAYTAVTRAPVNPENFGSARVINVCSTPPGTAGFCTLAWYQTNHPTWVMYTSDQLTPAYEFGDTTYIPLNISDPAVQSWLETNYYSFLAAQGYRGFTIDNINRKNVWGEVGTCSIAPTTGCTADGGTWTQLYTGAQIDPTFTANRIAWVTAYTAWAHSQNPPMATVGNITFDATDTTDVAALVNAVDVYYDEPGFTGDNNNPAPCDPAGGGSGVVGSAWIAKVSFIAGLNGGAGPNGYVSENSICPLGDFAFGSHTMFEILELAVASVLMVDNGSAVIIPHYDQGGAGHVGGTSYFNDATPTAIWGQTSWVHGAASGGYSVVGTVYKRVFANGLALVNPGSTPASIDLGVSVYHRFDCEPKTGVIAVPATSGMLLKSGASPSCVP